MTEAGPVGPSLEDRLRELFEDLLETAPSTDARHEREVIKTVERADEIEATRARLREVDIDREARP